MQKFQKGFTLIELMIGLVLGLFIVGGIYSVITSNTSSYRAVESSSIIHEDARVGMLYLRQQFQMAGYRSEQDVIDSVTNSSGSVFGAEDYTDGTDSFSFAEGQVITGVDGSDNYDKVAIRYNGSGEGSADNTIFNCTGTAIDEETTAVVLFSVQVDTIDGEKIPFLKCKDLNIDDAKYFPIMENVERFKLRYEANNRLISASAAQASNFSNISTLRFALLLKGKNRNLAVKNSQRTYPFLEETLVSSDFSDPYVMYEVFQDTVTLYNNI